MAMARFADRFRRGESASERVTERAPTSLLSVEPELESDLSTPGAESKADARPAEEIADTRPALLRRLAGETIEPKRRFGRLLAGKTDDTILAVPPPRRGKSMPRLGGLMARLTGEGPSRQVPARDEIDADAFEDIRRRIDETAAAPETDLDDAEKRLALALSKAGRLTEEIAKCNAALEDARRTIREEELKLARLRGLHDGVGGRTEAGQADLDTIQETLDTLRRMVDRLEPR